MKNEIDRVSWNAIKRFIKPVENLLPKSVTSIVWQTVYANYLETDTFTMKSKPFNPKWGDVVPLRSFMGSKTKQCAS